MWPIAFTAGVTLACVGTALWVRAIQSLDNALDHIAHGDLPHVPTCADMIDTLRAVEGIHCEAGAPVHSTANSLEA